jgi:hypothetical protein
VQVHTVSAAAALFTSHSKQTVKPLLIQKDSPELNRHVLTFLHPIFTVQDHIRRRSTAGDALRTTDTPQVICTSDHLSGAENPKGNSEYQKLCVCVLSSGLVQAF